jgi:hypothetical protein
MANFATVSRLKGQIWHLSPGNFAEMKHSSSKISSMPFQRSISR